MINTDSGVLFNIDIMNNINIIIKENMLIGKGSYGEVYYIGEFKSKKCIVKLSQTYKHNNEYEIENYFYKKYEFHTSDINGLPLALYIGKTENKLNSKKYDYIILEYVGIYNLCKIFNNIFKPETDVKHLINILYNSLYTQLTSIHKTQIVCRDISPSNIVISDMVTSFLLKKCFAFYKDIPYEIYKNIPLDITIENIIDKYNNNKYDELVRFVDAGIFCDLDVIDAINKYDNKNELLCGCFDEFDELDGLFGSTVEYTSPFCIFNFSSLIYKMENKTNIKNLIKNLLKMADIWSLNLVFLTYLYHIVTKNIYYGNIKRQLKSSPIMYTNKLNENIFLRMPFYFSGGKFFLSVDLEYIMNFDFSESNAEFIELQQTIKHCLNSIISFVNDLISKSKSEKWRYFVESDDDTILNIYENSKNCLNEMNNGILEFDEKMKEILLEHNKCKND
jgi:serine/threonine protein kinase